MQGESWGDLSQMRNASLAQANAFKHGRAETGKAVLTLHWQLVAPAELKKHHVHHLDRIRTVLHFEQNSDSDSPGSYLGTALHVNREL